jgi:mono/diheme cytochrome c family protein
MKQFLIIFGALLLCTSFLLLGFTPPSTAQALPEYAAQTGEPCSSCHISPSGGGPRGPRGQAWVASDKPAVVPDLTASLALLGVELNTDSAYFTVKSQEVREVEALNVPPVQSEKLFRWLSQYDGN